MPKTRPAQAPTARLGTNKPAGTFKIKIKEEIGKNLTTNINFGIL